jgi:hypothetical protein
MYTKMRGTAPASGRNTAKEISEMMAAPFTAACRGHGHNCVRQRCEDTGLLYLPVWIPVQEKTAIAVNVRPDIPSGYSAIGMGQYKAIPRSGISK